LRIILHATRKDLACDKEHDHLLWCLSSWAPTPPAISHLLLVLRLIEHDILN
jgi:hypothetical protein